MLQLPEYSLLGPARVAQALDERGKPDGRSGHEVLERDLVFEIVLVEQRRLDDVELLRACSGQLLFDPVEHVVLEHHGTEPSALGDLHQRLAALGGLEVIQRSRQGGLAVQSLPLDHDRQPEVHGEHDSTHRPVVRLDEVLHRGHHPVAGPTLVDGVVHPRT